MSFAKNWEETRIQGFVNKPCNCTMPFLMCFNDKGFIDIGIGSGYISKANFKQCPHLIHVKITSIMLSYNFELATMHGFKSLAED